MTDLSYIAPPVDRELIKKELKQRHFLRKSNYGNKEIYVTTAHLSPNIMREIGRLRELSFASDGGGTGKEVDIDQYQFSQEFINDYLPYTVELGRAFVQPAYQPSTNIRKGLYSLDNLSSTTTCPILSSWDELLCSRPTSPAPISARDSTALITSGTVWAALRSRYLRHAISSGKSPCMATSIPRRAT